MLGELMLGELMLGELMLGKHRGGTGACQLGAAGCGMTGNAMCEGHAGVCSTRCSAGSEAVAANALAPVLGLGS